MKTITLTFMETLSLRVLKEWWKSTDKILAVEFFVIVILIFSKVYINSRYIYEKNDALKNKREIKMEESKIKLMKIQTEKFRNLEKLNTLSKSLNMEENIDVIIVKQ